MRLSRGAGRRDPRSPGRIIEPTILSPSGLDRGELDPDAVRSLQRLQARGFEAYLVGGCVRDLLLGRKPKDFDIATAARPAQVKRTFPRNCRVIGRRFKLAHLHFEHNTKILEVSTFRRSPEGTNGEADDLLITRDNEFGNAEEDARRRDFTVNALFLDPLSDRIIDYVGGLADIHEGVLRTIGEPMVRFREDPVRILRAAKFAGRLSLRLESQTLEAMALVSQDLVRSAPPRMLEEILRLLRGGHALESFQILRDIGALKVILPVVGAFLADAAAPERVVFWRLLEALDARVNRGRVPTTPVLLGAIFLQGVEREIARRPDLSPTTIAEEVLGPFARELRLSRRDAGCVKRVCGVQGRFRQADPKRVRLDAFLRDPYFPEALELFELTVAASGAESESLAHWRGLAGGSRRHRPADHETPDDAGDESIDVAATADASEVPPAEFETGDLQDTDAPVPSQAEGGPRRRRRRRRRGRRGGGGGGNGGGGGTEAPGFEDVIATVPGGPDADTGMAAPAPGDAAPAVVEPDLEGDAGPADPHAEPGRRRRRRRRGRRGGGGGGGEAQGVARPQRPEAAAPRPDPPPRPERSPRQDRPASPRGRGGRRGGRRDRPRDSAHRPGNVEVLEPQAIDVSMFDVELDPKRVPTFGVLVDEKSGKRRRRPPPVDDSEKGYKPPPPPGQEPPSPTPPPPEPSDEPFGDW